MPAYRVPRCTSRPTAEPKKIRQTRTVSSVDTVEDSAKRSRSSIWNARTPPPGVAPVAQERLMPTRATALVSQAEGERRAKWAPILCAWVRRHLDRNSRKGYEACQVGDIARIFSLADFPRRQKSPLPGNEGLRFAWLRVAPCRLGPTSIGTTPIVPALAPTRMRISVGNAVTPMPIAPVVAPARAMPTMSTVVSHQLDRRRGEFDRR